jgi:chromosome condensin MukBEF ATPase and DNA-binding subunit MukB
VELNEVGRFDEAAYASDLAVASPLAYAYPEWVETRQEIETKKMQRASAHQYRLAIQCSVTITDAEARSTEAQVSQDQLTAWPEATGQNANSNLVRMPLPDVHQRAFAPQPTESAARGRVLEFASRTRSVLEEKQEDDLTEPRKTIADKTI